MNATMSSENLEHFPVMLDKILSIITPQHGGTFVDCTFGAGGYSKAILNFENTEVIALDRDQSVNLYAQPLIQKYNKRFKFYNNKFSQIDKISEANKSIKAIILDLGFSMFQMKNLSRGFSFNSTGPLDMRMGFNDYGANDVINKLDQKEIELILKYFGDERYNKRIALQIINLRRKKRIHTEDLVKIINKVKKKSHSRINQATKSFQALRIFVNNEISELIFGLINATKKLKTGSMLVVITFHSLEDKIVKYYFRTYSERIKNPSRYIPQSVKKDIRLFNCPQKKPLIPSKKEILINPPSRSAKLRYVIRNDNEFIFPKDLVNKFQSYLDIERIGLKL